MVARDLRWVRLGNNSKCYENFWYDDLSVVPEPASLLMLGLGGLLIGDCSVTSPVNQLFERSLLLESDINFFRAELLILMGRSAPF